MSLRAATVQVRRRRQVQKLENLLITKTRRKKTYVAALPIENALFIDCLHNIIYLDIMLM